MAVRTVRIALGYSRPPSVHPADGLIDANLVVRYCAQYLVAFAALTKPQVCFGLLFGLNGHLAKNDLVTRWSARSLVWFVMAPAVITQTARSFASHNCGSHLAL
jgi:hypothetical protein